MFSIPLADLSPENIAQYCQEGLDDFSILPALMILDNFAIIHWRSKYQEVERFVPVYQQLTGDTNPVLKEFISAYDTSTMMEEEYSINEELDEEPDDEPYRLKRPDVDISIYYFAQSEYYGTPVVFELEVWVNKKMMLSTLLDFGQGMAQEPLRLLGRLEQLLLDRPLHELTPEGLPLLLQSGMKDLGTVKQRPWDSDQANRRHFVHLDDHRLFQTAVRKSSYAEYPGSTCRYFSNNIEALDYIRSCYAINKPIHLIITDYNHPSGTGLEFASGVRRLQEEFGAASPIILLTMRADDSACVAAQETGLLDAYLTKDIAEGELCQWIKELVGTNEDENPF